jgi:hypothetical protein
MPSLSQEQHQLIEQWAAEGANLNQIQDRLRTECSMTLTYMETRLLILELGVKIQDKPRETPPEEKTDSEIAPPSADEVVPTPEADGGVKVTVDDLPTPGAIVSGKASFSDGNTVDWFMDQTGRFGLRGPAPGYQPPAADIPAFQRELDTQLSVRGF